MISPLGLKRCINYSHISQNINICRLISLSISVLYLLRWKMQIYPCAARRHDMPPHVCFAASINCMYVMLYLHFHCESLNEPLHLRCGSYLHEQIDLSHTHIRAICAGYRHVHPITLFVYRRLRDVEHVSR